MKKFSLISSTAVLVIGISGVSSNALAQSADAIYIVSQTTNPGNPAAQAIVSAINNFFTYVKTYVAYDWTRKQPNLSDITEPQNILGTQLTMTQNAAVQGLSGSYISSVVGPMPKGSVSSNVLSAAMASHYAFDVLPPTQQASLAYGASPQTLQLCGNNMFNFESLMGYSTYAKQTLACNPNGPQDVSKYANQYIQYVADLGVPINSFSISNAVHSSNPVLTLDQANNQLLPSQEWMDFTLTRRYVLAVQSATLSNLNYLYNQRAPDANGNSPESVANYIANWRTQNVNKWYDTMTTTADLPILLRENLFIMAEIQRDLHEMRKENQRNLALMAILASNNTLFAKQILNMRYAALQKKISDINGTSAGKSSASGASGTSGQSTTQSSIQDSLDKQAADTQAAIDAAKAAQSAGTVGTTGTTGTTSTTPKP